ncbi:hypothetical protein E2C01_088652 [Portunus trituberculatus]|uniref:Uncharacterized protein n=1 Tax=Portunus trituberculatus TaxID=210409 RepID=A0A5B7J9V5_PORTR|nr:hypothetical protein [Portunus trituberculatus]
MKQFKEEQRVLAVAVGLGAGLVLLTVMYCFTVYCCRRRASSPSSRGIFSRLRRASLYLSNTSPVDISMAELLFNVSAAPVHQPQNPILVPPGSHLCPSSYRPPPPPSSGVQSHQEVCRHFVGTATPSPRRPVPGIHQDATLDKRRKVRTSSLSVSQMEADRHSKVNMIRAGRDGRFESKVHSSDIHTEPRPRHRNEHQLARSPRPFSPSLPKPPPQSPQMIVSLYNSTASLPRQPQRQLPSPTPSWTYGKFLEQTSGSSTRPTLSRI